MEEVIAECRKQAESAMRSFLHDLSFVPADKLNWSPTPTAKSALQIAAHCAGYSGMFAWVIREGRWPCTVEEWQAKVKGAIDSIATVDEAEAMLRQGIAETLEAYDTVRPEQVTAMIEAPHATVPFKFFLALPARHLYGHNGQIDYLQTCWDDQEVHF